MGPLDKRDLLIDRLMFLGFCGLFFFIPIATSPAVILGIVTLSLWVFSGRCIRDRRWLRREWTLPVLAMMALPFIGLLYTSDLQTGLKFAKKSYYWLYAFAIAGVSAGESSRRAFINSYLLGISFAVAISVLQYLGLVPMPKGHATAFMGGQSPFITYSLLLVFGMLLLSHHFRTADTPGRRTMLLVLLGAFLFNLAVVPGRIGYVAFVCLSPLIVHNLLGGKHLFRAAAIAALLVAALLLSPTVQQRVKLAADEVRGYSRGEKTSSVGFRLYMWDGALRIIRENPFIGTGTGGYKDAMMKYKDSPDIPDTVQPHNSFLYMATSFGAVGLALFLWLLAVFFRKGWQRRESLAGFAVLSFGCVLLIGGLTDTQFLSLATSKLFALLMGVNVEDSG